jgi:hypothetical protein
MGCARVADSNQRRLGAGFVQAAIFARQFLSPQALPQLPPPMQEQSFE